MEDILRVSPGKRLEDVSWKTSSGRRKKKVVATSISEQNYDVFTTSLCRPGDNQMLIKHTNQSKSYFFKCVSING